MGGNSLGKRFHSWLCSLSIQIVHQFYTHILVPSKKTLQTCQIQRWQPGLPDRLQMKVHVHVEFENFYGTEPRHVDRRFELSLSDLTYLPKVDSPSPF